MFENVDGRTDGRRTDGRTTDGRTTDAGVTGILIAHLRAFGSGELKIEQSGKPTPEKMTSHGSVSDLPADIVSVDWVLIRLI